MSPEKRRVEILTLAPLNVTLFGNGVLAEVIKLRLRSYWSEVDPKSNDWCLYKEKEIWRHTERRRPSKTEAEIGMMKLQAKERQGLPATIRSWKR